jgi:hypothetical protein
VLNTRDLNTEKLVGTAPLARTETSFDCSLKGREEACSFALGAARRTRRAAEDERGGHTVNKGSIEAFISIQDSLPTLRFV